MTDTSRSGRSRTPSKTPSTSRSTSVAASQAPSTPSVGSSYTRTPIQSKTGRSRQASPATTLSKLDSNDAVAAATDLSNKLISANVIHSRQRLENIISRAKGYLGLVWSEELYMQLKLLREACQSPATCPVTFEYQWETREHESLKLFNERKSLRAQLDKVIEKSKRNLEQVEQIKTEVGRAPLDREVRLNIQLLSLWPEISRMDTALQDFEHYAETPDEFTTRSRECIANCRGFLWSAFLTTYESNIQAVKQMIKKRAAKNEKTPDYHCSLRKVEDYVKNLTLAVFRAYSSAVSEKADMTEDAFANLFQNQLRDIDKARGSQFIPLKHNKNSMNPPAEKLLTTMQHLAETYDLFRKFVKILEKFRPEGKRGVKVCLENLGKLEDHIEEYLSNIIQARNEF